MLLLSHEKAGVSPQQWIFGPERTLVRIGRDPERCDVALEPEEVRVSREHCALELVLGRYRLLLNHENPVYVDGKPAFEGQVVQDGSALRLGDGGPVLRLKIEASSHMPSTLIIKPTKQERPEEVAERVVAPVRRHKKWLAGAIAGVAVLSGFGLYLWTRTTERLMALEEVQPDAEARRQLRAVLAEKAESAAMQAIAKRAEDSVYLVMVKGAAVARPIGTAWVLDRSHGLLATCAHVVFQQQNDASALLLRSGQATPRDVRITGVDIHPGFARFCAFAQAYSVGGQVTPGRNTATLIPAYDCAILTVDPRDREALGLDLGLASAEVCKSLGSGVQLAARGFPLEDVAGNYDRPQSRAQFGHVLASSDFFLGRAPLAESMLLHTDVRVAGGFSGSPLFDTNGKVVGIMSAGSFFFLRSEGDQSKIRARIPTSIVTYAQRVDVLEDMRSGKAANVQAVREGRWKSEMEAIRKAGDAEIADMLVERCLRSSNISAGVATGKWKYIANRKGTIAIKDAASSRSYAIKDLAPGSYAVVAWTNLLVDPVESEFANLDLSVGFKSQARVTDLSAGPQTSVLLERSAGGTLDITISAEAPAGSTVPFDLVVVQFER